MSLTSHSAAAATYICYMIDVFIRFSSISHKKKKQRRAYSLTAVNTMNE